MDARILIVDDLEANRSTLKKIIEDMGCTPVLAGSAEQALAVAAETLPRLVLSDISMPGMGGYELCSLLKKSRTTRDIPFIFIPLSDSPQDIMEGFRKGGDDYIVKPFVPELVQARVRVHLRFLEANGDLAETNRRLRISVGEQLKQIEQEKKDVLYALADIAVRNSSYGKEHINRLSRNCRILAQGMQFSPLFEDKISDAYVDTIELAAPLCDIGNIGVPVNILKKQAKLTDEEMAVVQTHTDIGAKLLEELHVGSDYNDFISMAVDIAHYHHENWDGSGYPAGLLREKIPLAAQIVSVMGVYCALTEKKNCTREEAFDIMGREADVKYNPEIFKISRKISRQLC